ncbi:MAG: response regulator [Phycisphaera sp. RhM]|nr:response regulator [Phycisphaera sp. RhM]
MSQLTERSNHRILVIDDTPSIHNDFIKILVSDDSTDAMSEHESALFGDAPPQHRRKTYTLDSAMQGKEGLAKVEEALNQGLPYAMAFVDMRMPPGLDGLETIEKIWQRDPRLEIVICTAYSDYSWSEISERLGASPRLLILKKPFDNAEVEQLASCLTEKWTMARTLERRMQGMEAEIANRTEEIERAYQETEALLAAISSILIETDSTGVVRRWNASAETLFGIPASVAVGSAVCDLEIEWADADCAARFLGAHRESELSRGEFRLLRDGGAIVLSLSIYPVVAEGAHCGCLYLGTDITTQSQLEQQLHQAQRLEAVGQLAAGVAHEINTPMQYVGDNLDFLQSKMLKLQPLFDQLESLFSHEDVATRDELLQGIGQGFRDVKGSAFLEDTSEAIGDSQEGVQHVSRIVRAMKEFAHPGQEDKTLVDINRAIESTIAVSTNEWKYAADIENKLAADTPPVPAFAGELNQVFLNLLVNAAHAIADTNGNGATGKGTITVSTRHCNQFVEVQISDTGTGIPEAIRHRIFDPFFTTKEIGKGTGQGLAIAHSVIVQKHGGRLHCESTPGLGTTFCVQLPIDSPESNADGDLKLQTAEG